MLLLLLIWMIAELAAIVAVAEWIGIVWMLVLLVASWPLGLSIMRHEGRGALTRVSSAAAAGRAPKAEVIDGALVIGGGVLLMIPGFISDLAGALLLIGPTRRLAGRALAHSRRTAWLRRMAETIGGIGSFGGFGRFGGPGGFGGTGNSGNGFDGHGQRRYDAESEAVDIDDRELERRGDG